MVDHAIDTGALLKEVASSRNGAAVLFVGTVRDMNDGESVTALDYSAYGQMATKELAGIALEASERWDTPDIVVEHRTGALAIGDISVAVAAAHPHRAQAFEAARYVIEELKRRAPIWKREHYADGRADWVAANMSGVGNRESGIEPRPKVGAE